MINMILEEAKEILYKNGYILEDTDELDDADLPIGIKPQDYHKQKSKMLSLMDKIKLSINNQTEKT